LVRREGGREGGRVKTGVEDEEVVEAFSTIPTSEDVQATRVQVKQRRGDSSVIEINLCTRALL
jgi:ribosomal protein L10